MKRILISYAAALLALVGLDFLWLSNTAQTIYQPALNSVMAADVNYPAAIIFYLMYPMGIVFFAVNPALRNRRWNIALINGLALGFFAYATYDLTNLATLRVWSIKVSLIDVAWGTLLTGMAAAFSYGIRVLSIRNTI